MNKVKVPAKFKLAFSEGIEWIEQFLHSYAKKLPKSEAFCVSKKLYNQILKHNEHVLSSGLPPHLHLAYVHPKVKTGVFLKPEEKPIKVGALIGIYTGAYQLVPESLGTNTSYAYDVATGIHVPKDALQHVLYAEKDPSTKEEYAIQTNAFPKGNFTRFINHSSLQPNIEAVVSKFPEGRIEILLFALKEIKPGEQLLSNYGGQYWKALDIIPSDMIATTYKLNAEGKSKLNCKIADPSKAVITKLLTLRNAIPTLPDKLKDLVTKSKKTCSKLSKKDENRVEAFEEIMLEKGLPRCFEWNASCTKLRLKKQEKAIPKNGWIGILGGTFTLQKANTAIALIQIGKKTLLLDLAKETNSFALCKQELDGNMGIHLVYDEERETLLPLLFATKKIKPGDTLTLNPEIDN